MAKTKISGNNEEKAGKNANSKKKQTVLIILVVLLLAASSLGTYTFFFNQAAEGKNRTEEKESLDMGEMVVNLSGSGARYLRVKVVIDHPKNKKLKEELVKRKHIVSDTIISTLRSKTLADVSNADSIQGLKEDLIEKINNNLDSGEISGVYFTDFLVQ